MAGSPQVPISSQGLDIDERFAHLLNPIRDLAKNWEVNLASDLEVYLSQMVNQEVPSQNGVSSFNFAQAALLIQGSTCVYSKKVEYFHSLFYQSFDKLFNKKKNPLPTSITPNGRDKDLTFDNNPANNFLSLDDVDDVRGSLNNPVNRNRKSSPVAFPKTPLPSSPAEASNDAEVDGSNGDSTNKFDFKLNTSSNHSDSGTLLLSRCNASLIHDGGKEIRAVFPNQEIHPAPCPVPDYPADHQDYDDAPPMDYPATDDSTSSMGDHFVPPPPPEAKNNPYNNRLPKQPEIMACDKIKVLDPHEETGMKRSLRKRIMVKMPPTLTRNNGMTKARKRKADGCPIELKVEPISPISKFCNFTNLSRMPLFPKNPRQIPNFQLLEDLYWSALKRRRELLINHRKTMKDQVAEEELEDLDDNNNNFDDDVPDDLGPNVPYGKDEHQGDHFGDSGRDTGREERRKSVLNANDVSAIDEPIPSSYEVLVQNFLKDASKFCRVTDMGQRVNEWADRIKPQLAQEEARKPYDIHEYGSRILNCYQDNNRKQTLPFSKIVHGLDRSEVSRFFLASLQLANTHNVEISTTGILEEGMDTMELTLLSRKRHHVELQDFRAPSQ